MKPRKAHRVEYGVRITRRTSADPYAVTGMAQRKADAAASRCELLKVAYTATLG